MPRKDNHKRVEFLIDPDSHRGQELLAILDDIKRQTTIHSAMHLALYILGGLPLPDDLRKLADELLADAPKMDTANADLVEKMQTDIEDLQFTLQAVIQEQHALRADMETLSASGDHQEAMARLEQKFEQLAHTVDQLSVKIETLQLTGGQLPDDDLSTPLSEPLDPRQADLSAKLKRMQGQFEKLQ